MYETIIVGSLDTITNFSSSEIMSVAFEKENNLDSHFLCLRQWYFKQKTGTQGGYRHALLREKSSETQQVPPGIELGTLGRQGRDASQYARGEVHPIRKANIFNGNLPSVFRDEYYEIHQLTPCSKKPQVLNVPQQKAAA